MKKIIFLSLASVLVFHFSVSPVFAQPASECASQCFIDYDNCIKEATQEITPSGREVIVPGRPSVNELETACGELRADCLKACGELLPSTAPGTPTPKTGFGASQGVFEQTGKAAGVKGTEQTLEQRVSSTINIFLSVLGIVFLVLTTYGGLIWITARGEEAQAEKAKNIITRAVFGLIVIAAAYAITFFVLGRLIF